MNTSACCNTSTTCSSAELFSATIQVLAAAQCCFTDEFTSDAVDDKLFFDFIIVGAGSAGSVVANRLSEVGKWNILLLEAGKEPPPQAFVPALTNTLRKTQYDWNYTTIDNHRTSQAMRNGQVDWTRGKLLGGSSELNGMFYVKGNKEDYQSWYDKGNPSWSPENVFRFERKAESLQNQELKRNPFIDGNYGKNGPQIVNRFNSTREELHERILESWDSLNIKKVIDTNSAEYKSPGICSKSLATAASGIRFGTYRSYILPVRQRDNLKIVTEAIVTKILIDNKTAYGVEVNVKGQINEFYAKKEVILSAGAINSPQILMLSGVGPRQHLELKKIPAKVNLPSVGKHLQDHLRIIVPIYGDVSKFDTRDENNCAIEEYCRNRTGYLAQVGLDNIISFYSYHENLKYPELQNHVIIAYENATSFASGIGYKDEVNHSLFKYFPDKTLYMFFVVLLHPLSMGSVTLNTSSPYDKPIIDANYFGDRRDLLLTAKGINILTEIINTEFFKSINAYIPRIKWPECDKYRFNSTGYWMCFAKNTVTTIYHPTSTCRMGPKPLNSVVDNFLRVHGVKNLRVIDASTMPSIVSGNINGPTIMIGEMGSAMIKNTYNEK